jgi:hypothetical protein
MRPHEVYEQAEQAHGRQQRNIGLTTAVVAVLLAVATMFANDANTQKIVVETKTADWWATAHSNETNARLYMASERLAEVAGQKMAAEEFHKLYVEQDKESKDAILSAQGLEYASRVLSRHASYGEIAELFLELSVVLCSVSLLSESKLFWRMSFLSTAAGVGLIAALLLH